MSQFKVLSIVVLGFIALFSEVTCDCECSATTFAACVNQTAFAVCFDGVKKSEQIVQCPDGQICTDQQGICMDDDGTATPACTAVLPQCNTCSGPFACISETQFAFCDGNGQATGATAKCQEGKFCSIEHFVEKGTLCAPWCAVEPTCSNTEPVTTPAPEPEWQKSCDDATATGTYPNIYDTTCKTYVYCEMQNESMHSVLFTCKSGYFNHEAKVCQEAKPANCE